MSAVDEAAVFNAARKIGPLNQRDAYLRDACGANESAYERLVALLQSYDADPGFLEAPPIARQSSREQGMCGEGPGAVLGRYRLLERIGEGGFAVVYAALQSSPLRRQVAVKIIKAGMDSQQVIARFEAERQTLALMDHPGIAQVFDAGVTEAGRPYFAMQLIRGEPLTDYCDRRRLPIAERLQLFLDVCRAVQHAHQKGVIHRDLKPSNVLVEMQAGRHVPKVIDFGIAKATDRRLQASAVDSQCYQIMGTPRYMSPEQADGSRRDVDTRSDIYSLGVLLYEMLTGGAPHYTHDSTLVSNEAAGEAARQSTPKSPSSQVFALGERAESAAALRQVNAAGLRKTLRGDLDWIVLKCLETSRERRYDSADALGQDIERHLVGLPPREWRVSLVQRAWRWGSRNRLVAALSLSVVTLVLLVATIAPLIAWQQQRLVEDTRRQLYAKDVAGAYDAWNDAEFGQVRDLLFAALGEQIVAAGGAKRGPGFLRVWNSATGEMTTELPFADTFVRDLDVSPQGDRVALVRLSYADNARLEVWGNLRQQPEVVWSRPASRSHDIVAYSPCGRLLAVGRLGGESNEQGPAAVVTLWDAETGRAVQDISWGREISRIAISVDGRYVASIDWDGGLELFDRQHGEVVLETTAHNPVGSNLAFAPDGRILATSSSNCEVKFWHLPTLMRVATLPAHARVGGLAFFPDGRTLAVGCLDRTVELWHVDREREIWRMEDVEPLSAARSGFDEVSTSTAQ